MPTVAFVSKLPAPPADGFFIDLTESGTGALGDHRFREVRLADFYRRHGTAWKHAFIDWLGALNAANARLDWWAYASTAKNLLSSPLGTRLFQVLATLKFTEQGEFERLYIIGATAAQRAVISAPLALQSRRYTVEDGSAAPEFSDLKLITRVFYQALHAWFAMLRWHGRFPERHGNLFAFTYVDANIADGNDAFFGKLPSLLAREAPDLRLLFLAYVQAPYRRVAARLAAFTEHKYWPLLFELRLADVAWGVRQALGSMRNAATSGAAGTIEGVDAGPLLAEAFRWDLAKGGYLYNLLIYRAARTFARRVGPKRVLYPYENKSLEKAFILGLREGRPDCRIIGYQHTSITPRHTTLLFAREEAGATPLPDLIVTAGDVTRAFLEEHGNYPSGIFATGCALRQSWGDAPIPSARSGRQRVLLALSSSRFELTRAVEFFAVLDERGIDCEIGVRPHPEFPLSLLPHELRNWVSRRARDFTGSNLRDNLEWCSAVAYVSSTVALEAMMRGKPAINIDLGEIVVPDPVLGDPPLWRRVSSPEGFARTLRELAAVPPEKFNADLESTFEFLRAYFRPITPAGLGAFLR